MVEKPTQTITLNEMEKSGKKTSELIEELFETIDTWDIVKVTVSEPLYTKNANIIGYEHRRKKILNKIKELQHKQKKAYAGLYDR